jgi:long-chain-fatty-acid--CoA ligase ACSBG
MEAFGSYGIPIYEMYAMSESSAYGTISSDVRQLWGSCGFAAPGGQVRVFKHGLDSQEGKVECPKAKDIDNPTEAEQGEICMRGRNVMMGYLANPKFGEDHVLEMQQKTGEAIDEDGWLHTGDMGCIGENGFIRVTGRYKELIITSGGENVAPVPIEDGIKKLCPAISNCIMIGDKRKFNTCLVTLKTKEDGQQLARTALLVEGVETLEAARQSAEYRAVIEKAITANNKDSKVCPSNASKVQKFEILPADFTVEGEELTSTLKLRRGIVQSKYADVIESFYQ